MLKFICRLDKCLDGEGVVLRGDGKPCLALGSVDEPFLEHSILGDDLSRVSEEFLPVLRDGDPAVGAQKERQPQLLLQFTDRAGQRRLGDVKPVGGLVHAAAVRNGDCIFHLLKRHVAYLPSLFFHNASACAACITAACGYPPAAGLQTSTAPE